MKQDGSPTAIPQIDIIEHYWTISPKDPSASYIPVGRRNILEVTSNFAYRMLPAFGRRKCLVLALARQWSSQRDEVLQGSVVVYLDGNSLESFVAAVRTKPLRLVEGQLEASVASLR